MLEIFNTLAYFFEDNYVKISVREFAKFKKISPPHASKLLNFFTREGLLTKEEDRRYHFFQANRENKLFVKLQQEVLKNGGNKKLTAHLLSWGG